MSWTSIGSSKEREGRKPSLRLKFLICFDINNVFVIMSLPLNISCTDFKDPHPLAPSLKSSSDVGGVKPPTRWGHRKT